MHIEISQMQTGHIGLLSNLWQYYQLESSAREGLEIDSAGRFETPEEVFVQALQDKSGSSAHIVQCNGVVAGFLILHAAEIEGKPIAEFADLYVLPKHRGRGVATAVVEQVILRSAQPWLIAVFRDDSKAQGFWRSAFKRLPFTSCREIVPPELPEFHEFVVNDGGA
jgi:predicted acetyltransferase